MYNRRWSPSSAGHGFPAGRRPQDQYEGPFESWLRARGIKLESLRRENPRAERLFWSDFDTLMVWRAQQKRGAAQSSDDASGSEEEGEIREEDEEVAVKPLVQCAQCALRGEEAKAEADVATYGGTRSRSELLATRVMPADEFRRVVKRHGPNGYMGPSDKLPPIPIVLRADESPETYEAVFQKWLRFKDVTLEMLKEDPEEERRYRQCYAYTRLRKKKWKETAKYRQRPQSRGRSPPRALNDSPDWDRKRKYPGPSSYEKYGGDKYEKRPRQSSYREGDYSISPAYSEDVRHGDAKYERPVHDARETALNSKVDRFFEELGQEVGQLYAGDSIRVKDLDDTRPIPVVAAPPKYRAEKYDGPIAGTDISADFHTAVKACCTRDLEKCPQIRNCADIIDAALRTVAEAEQLQSDPLKQRLRENYVRLTDQISVNEMAMDDLLVYVKKIETSDAEEASYNLSQIEEAAASVNEVKRKRDTALAVMVAHEHMGKESLLGKHHQPSVDETVLDPDAHKRLALMYSELKRKEEGLEMLKTTLKVMLMKFATAHETQAEELHQLVRTVSVELSSRSQLENQCQTLSLNLLRRSNYSSCSDQKREDSRALAA